MNHHHFNYIELPTTDMLKMKAFYTDVFGWNYVDYEPTYAAITGAGIDGGFDAQADRKPSSDGVLVVIISEDLQESEKSIRIAGGDITVPIFDFPGGQRFHFKDPSGNELAVWCPAGE